MAYLGNIDLNDVKPADSFDSLPAGTYMALISASEMKATKAGTGEYLQLTMTIIDGEYEHRKLFDRLNLNNPNQTAVDMAKRTLASIGHAVGVWPPQDSAELHDIPLMVKVEVETERDPVTKQVTRTSNVVKGYSAVAQAGAAAASRAAAAPVQHAAPAAASKPALPWAKKAA